MEDEQEQRLSLKIEELENKINIYEKELKTVCKIKKRLENILYELRADLLKLNYENDERRV